MTARFAPSSERPQIPVAKYFDSWDDVHFSGAEGPIEDTIRKNILSYEQKRQIKSAIKKYADARGLSVEAYLDLVQQHIETLIADSSMFSARFVSSFEDLLNGSGRLKSSFEANYHGIRLPFHAWQRIKKEHKLFGFPKKGAPVSKRPIYGYLSSSQHGEVQQERCFSTIKKFGNIHLKFKAHMRRRATVTLNESFNALFESFIATPLAKPHYLSAPFLKGDPLRMPPSALAAHYYEIQLHGGVRVLDIESVHIQKECMNPEEYARVIRAFKTYQQGPRWAENPIQLIEY